MSVWRKPRKVCRQQAAVQPVVEAERGWRRGREVEEEGGRFRGDVDCVRGRAFADGQEMRRVDHLHRLHSIVAALAVAYRQGGVNAHVERDAG